MKIFTTNWYLYNPHFNLSSKEAGNPKPTTEVYGLKKPKTEVKNMSFDKILLEAIDEAFFLLGESLKAEIYYYLEKTYNIKKQDIPNKIEKFTETIEKLLGSGAKIVEVRIMKILYKKAGCELTHYKQQKDLEFTEYIAAIKLAKKNCLPKTKQLNRNRNEKKIVMFAQIP
jgi:hypothetical protein